jgi:hypothetical protein
MLAPAAADNDDVHDVLYVVGDWLNSNSAKFLAQIALFSIKVSTSMSAAEPHKSIDHAPPLTVSLQGVLPHQRYPLPENALGLQAFMVLKHRPQGRPQNAGYTWHLFINDNLPTIYPPNEDGFVKLWRTPDEARNDLARQLRQLGVEVRD